MVVEFRYPNTCPPSYSYWSFDGDAATPPRYVVTFGTRRASGADEAPEGYTGWSRRDTRGTSSSGQADNTETWTDTKEMLLQIAPADLWKLQELRSNKKGSLSPTKKKHRGQHEGVRPDPEEALSSLAIENATFEQADQILEAEISEGNLLFADVRTAMDKLSPFLP